MAKTFDQYLAESGRQSELDDLRRTGRYDAARSQYESGGGGYGSSGGSSVNFEDSLRRAQELSRQSIQPIVSSLESSIPEIQKTIQTSRDTLEKKKAPLAARYDTLLADIKGQGQVATNRQTVATSNELGKRGILGSSGVAEQEMTNALNPITEKYAGLIKDTGLAKEQALQGVDEQIAGLSSTEIEQVRNVRNAIAQAQASGNANAASTALQMVSQAQAQMQAEQAMRAQEQERALQQRMYEQVTLPQSQASIQNINSEIAARNKSTQGASGLDINSFLGMFGMGGSTGGNTSSMPPNVSKLYQSDPVAAYNLWKNP